MEFFIHCTGTEEKKGHLVTAILNPWFMDHNQSFCTGTVFFPTCFLHLKIIWHILLSTVAVLLVCSTSRYCPSLVQKRMGMSAVSSRCMLTLISLYSYACTTHLTPEVLANYDVCSLQKWSTLWTVWMYGILSLTALSWLLLVGEEKRTQQEL